MSEILNNGIYPYPKNSLWLIENYEHMTIYPMNKRDLTYVDTTIGIIGSEISQYKIIVAKSFEDYDDKTDKISEDEGVYIESLIVLDCEDKYDESPAYIERYLKSYFADKKQDNDWYELSVKDIIAIRNLFYHIHGDYIIDNVKEFFLLQDEI